MKKIIFLLGVLILLGSYKINNTPPVTKHLSVITSSHDNYDSLFYDTQERLIRHEEKYFQTLFNYKNGKVEIITTDKSENKVVSNLVGTLNSDGQIFRATGFITSMPSVTFTYQYDANKNLTKQSLFDNTSDRQVGREIYTYNNGDLISWEHQYGREYEKWAYTYTNIDDKTGLNQNPKSCEISSGMLFGIGNKHLIASESYLGFGGIKRSEHTYTNTLDADGYLAGRKKIQTYGYSSDTVFYKYKYN